MNTMNFGPNQKMTLTEPLDTWLSVGLRDIAVPEAVGSSARVFRLHYKPLMGDFANYPVIKVMRHDKTHYALPLFESEARILDRMKEVPGITPLLGLGFLQLSEGEWPLEIAPLTKTLEETASASQLSGTAELYAPDEVEIFLNLLQQKVEEGELAFFVFPRRWEDNLFLRCDAGYTRGEYRRSFPVELALKAAVQISKILEAAHARNIVYLDHKILHYYWNEPRQQVFTLDWNIGRIIDNGNTQEVFAFDVLQFSARALHHMLTGRQAPGSVKVGPNLVEEIQNAPDHYEPIWTYDDQKRLSQDELDLLSAALQGKYQTAADLLAELERLLAQRQS